MIAKIKLGIYEVINDFIEPDELEESKIDFPEFTITVTKIDGELKVSSATDFVGHDIMPDLYPYELEINYL